MPDGIRDLLVDAENQFEPSAEFVERLARELDAVGHQPAAVLGRKRAGTVLVSMTAAAMVVVLGLSVFVGNGGPGSAGPTDSNLVAAESDTSAARPDAIGELPLSMARACDSFLIDIGSMLWTGNGQSIAYPSSTSSLSAASLYEIRDSLNRIASLHQLNSAPTSPTAEILSIAIGEFGQAALFVQLGEGAEAQQHIDRATAVLDDLSGAPGLRGCLEL